MASSPEVSPARPYVRSAASRSTKAKAAWDCSGVRSYLATSTSQCTQRANRNSSLYVTNSELTMGTPSRRRNNTAQRVVVSVNEEFQQVKPQSRTGVRLSTGTSSARPGVSRSMHQAVSRVCLSSATSFSHSHSYGAAGRFGPFDRRPPRPTRAVADDDLPEAFCRSDMALEQCTSVTEKLIYNREGDAPSGVNRAHTHALRAELPFLRNYSTECSA